MQDPKPSLRSRTPLDPMAALPGRVRVWAWMAWGLMLVEQTARALSWAAIVVALFAILALFDAFAVLPLWLHWVALAGFVGALGWALWHGFRGWQRPARLQVLHRLPNRREGQCRRAERRIGRREGVAGGLDSRPGRAAPPDRAALRRHAS